MYTYFTLYFTLYLFHGHIFICVVSHLPAYLERQSQLNMKKQKGRGKGRGRGRGGSRKKPIAEDDDDEDEDEDDDGDDNDEDDEDEEEQEEEEEKPMKSKKNKRHDPKEKNLNPNEDWKENRRIIDQDGLRRCGKSMPSGNGVVTGSSGRMRQHGISGITQKVIWQICSAPWSSLDSTSQKESGKKPTKNPKKKKAEQQDDEKDHIASRSKHSKESKKSKSTADQEETTVKKRKLEVDTVPAQSFEVPRKVRDQANLIACFAKKACELGYQKPHKLNTREQGSIEKEAPHKIWKRPDYKRPGFSLHVEAIKKDFGYFSVEGTKGNFLVRLAASWKAASMLVQNLRLYYY